jgi:hypothetical protein
MALLALESPFQYTDDRWQLFTKRSFFKDPTRGMLVFVEWDSPHPTKKN